MYVFNKNESKLEQEKGRWAEEEIKKGSLGKNSMTYMEKCLIFNFTFLVLLLYNYLCLL